ncbi:MAG: hypothetical protein GQ559_02795 [Desulfobulbaceae bacterium]|nr:hypothetical protein [Desulfobulbaceae bacterium]
MAFAGNAFAYDDVIPSVAADMVAADMVANADAYILDVRTEAEWMYVGHPGPNKLNEGVFLDGKVINISYKIWRKGFFIVNPSFISEVDEFFEDIEDLAIITMCRSGQRSVDAAKALEDAGFTNVYNMLTGFEGEKDAAGYRTENGWKIDDLPYNYSGDDAYAD